MIGRAVIRSLLMLVWQLAAAIASHADLTVEMTTIGNPGNAADTYWWGSVGGVGYVYQISTYEVTVAQYVEFLNAKAQSDPYGLYNPNMMDGPHGSLISQSGTDGSYSYSAVAGTENQPVRYVSFYDGLRLCNWLSNGQGSGDTETGSYDLSLGMWATRGTSATWVLPSEDEWYKAAYYSASNTLYHTYPTGSDTEPAKPTDSTSPREANWGGAPYWGGDVYYTSIGQTTGRSSYGVADMGGNVEEWTETFSHGGGEYRITRGGMFESGGSDMSVAGTIDRPPSGEGDGTGFRLAYVIPEPSTVVLLLTALPLALFAGCRSRRRLL